MNMGQAICEATDASNGYRKIRVLTIFNNTELLVFIGHSAPVSLVAFNSMNFYEFLPFMMLRLSETKIRAV